MSWSKTDSQAEEQARVDGGSGSPPVLAASTALETMESMLQTLLNDFAANTLNPLETLREWIDSELIENGFRVLDESNIHANNALSSESSKVNAYCQSFHNNIRRHLQ